jgi:leader peptidase (prepilin peptidase)/N-methyltransferase
VYLFHIFSFIFGALVGSFLNVVILRLPDPEASIVLPPSHCPSCHAPIRWFDNIPILSFLLLGRRCRACKKAISWQYPLVELAMGLLSLALFQRYLISLAFAGYFLFTAALLVVIFIDLKHQIIPDLISLPGMVIGFAFSLINPYVTWQNSAIGLVIGGGVLYAVALGYYLLTRKEGMGGGDIKLLAMIGAWLGWQSLPFVVFSSSLIGSLAGIGAMVKQKKGGKTIIPYGPFLSMSALLFLFFQGEILCFMHRMHWLP